MEQGLQLSQGTSSFCLKGIRKSSSSAPMAYIGPQNLDQYDEMLIARASCQEPRTAEKQDHIEDPTVSLDVCMSPTSEHCRSSHAAGTQPSRVAGRQTPLTQGAMGTSPD